MTVDQFVTVVGALTALVAAVGAVFVQVRQTHELVNHRMTELLDVTKQSALAQGALAERREPGQNPGSGTST